MSERDHLPSREPAIYLDDSADAQRCGAGGLEISELGMRFLSTRRFSIGTTLAVTLHQMHPRLGLCRIELEGLVVWCEPGAGHRCECTLLFLELPDAIRPCLREFSHALAAPRTDRLW